MGKYYVIGLKDADQGMMVSHHRYKLDIGYKTDVEIERPGKQL